MNPALATLLATIYWETETFYTLKIQLTSIGHYKCNYKKLIVMHKTKLDPDLVDIS